MENVETEPLVREDSLCKELLLEAMKYHLLPEQRSSLVSQRTLERKPEGMKPYIFAVGGGSLFAIHNECEVYNPKTNNWSAIAPMISRRSRAGVASLRKLLWVCESFYVKALYFFYYLWRKFMFFEIQVVGGYDGENDLATAECYNPLINEWRSITPMGTKRSW
jgi:kelch-like protein 17 (actinfilin)